MDLLLFGLGQLLVLALLGVLAWSAGALAARGFGREDLALPAGFRLALGFALLCQLLLALGFLGWLRPLPILAAAGLLLAASWRWGAWRGSREGLPGRRARLAAAGLLAPVFVLALYPPLGFDQTLYHLPFSRAFARTGALPFLGELRFPVFPPLVEVLQAAIWQLAGVIATQQAGLLALAALLCLLWAWAREKAGEEAGYLASAMLLGSPCAVYLATCGYLEPPLALLVLGALYAAEKAPTPASQPAWPLAAGFLAGSAAAAKYHGLFFLAAAALLLLRRADLTAGAPGYRRLARRLAHYGAAALVAALPCYARIYGWTGNPLFPFYSELFGSGPWTEETMLPRGEERWSRVLTLFWDLIFRRERVGLLPPYSPAFLLALPAGLFAAWRFEDLRPLFLAAFCFLLISPTHGHYFLTIAAIWALLLATTLHRLLAGPARRRVLVGAAILLALGGPAYAFYRMRLLSPPPAGEAGRQRLLAAQLPAYEAILFLNREAPGEAVFAAGPELARMTVFLDGQLLGDVNGSESVQRVAERTAALGSLSAALEETGARLLLLGAGETAWLAAAAADPRLEKIFEDAGAAVYRLRAPAAAAS